VITAYSDLQAAIDAINRGQAQRYLRKPWDTHELRLVVGEAFEAYQVHRRVRDLEQRLIATERVYALGVVGAGVAHELRNPLSALKVGLEYFQSLMPQLRRGAGPDVLDDADQVLDDMELGLRAVLDIAESMSLTTRSRAEGLVDLAEVVTLASRAVRGEARRRARLELDLQPVPRIDGSRTRLGQVVLNLVVNALEAMDPAAVGRNLVRVRLRSSGGRVQLSVEDNGPGIPPAAVDRIFDPFFTTKLDGGTGLGLAISRQIVSEHRGTLTVRSVLGEGTSFLADLPAVSAPG
jgi:two-component system, NtrC family, sensor kinase